MTIVCGDAHTSHGAFGALAHGMEVAPRLVISS